MRYPSEWIEELRARADIVSIVSEYVPLKQNGRRFWGCCPFHSEKTPSFSVSPDQVLYYCFGCTGGTVIQFVMEAETHGVFGSSAVFGGQKCAAAGNGHDADERKSARYERIYELNRKRRSLSDLSRA